MPTNSWSSLWGTPHRQRVNSMRQILSISMGDDGRMLIVYHTHSTIAGWINKVLQEARQTTRAVTGGLNAVVTTVRPLLVSDGEVRADQSLSSGVFDRASNECSSNRARNSSAGFTIRLRGETKKRCWMRQVVSGEALRHVGSCWKTSIDESTSCMRTAWGRCLEHWLRIKVREPNILSHPGTR